MYRNLTYADDTNFFISSPNANSLITEAQVLLYNVSELCSISSLKLSCK